MARSVVAPEGEGVVGGTGRRTGLERADVVARALDLVHREGPDALTMRRLATDLGVGTPTIYWHVANRDELVAEVVRLQATRSAQVEVQGSTPRERVFDAARHLWDTSIEHRAVTSLAHQTGTSALLLHHQEEALVVELEAAGLDGATAAEACRAIVMAVGGALLQELRDLSQSPPEHRPTTLWQQSEAPISDQARLALTAPADVDTISATVLRAVIDHYVPT